MSTKPKGLRVLIAAAVAAGLAGCALSPPDDGSARHFSDLRIGGHAPAQPDIETPPPAPTPPPAQKQAAARPASPPTAPAPVPEAPAAMPAASVPPLAPAGAAERVGAYLASLGFTEEDSREGAVQVIAATRMAEPRRIEAEANCALEAMRRPTFSAANLTVRLAPGAHGTEVGVESSFVEVNQNLISGALVREACRSRGVLERGVRRAALGG